MNRDCLEKCPNNYFEKIYEKEKIINYESLKRCEICDEKCSSCKEKNDYCLSCKDDYFFKMESFSCAKICPDGFYANLEKKICEKCYTKCLKCKGPSENDCNACDESEDLILDKGSCIKKGCKEGFIKLADKDECFSLDNCITFANLSVPKLFSLDSEPLIGKFSYKLANECLFIKKDFTFDWDKQSLEYDNSKINPIESTYIVNNEYLKPGKFELFANILYKENPLKKINAMINIFLFKVINIFF